ncbi:MAG: DUF4097 family beta strand repeat-containing protein [Clostridia bacterium]|nr:DUF4097 family beta strand repeat-containing protein [Clostridia bacterium]
MAQNQIRKGFFFYFGLLILFLVTLALIFMVVLIFSPNKDFIGLRYFSYTSTVSVTELSGEESAKIDYSKVKTIEIDCGYADVSFKKGGENWHDGIHIRNDAKGFTTAANAIDFTYTATLENNKLTVKLTEPTGFLYFSKNINVVIYATSNSNFLDGKEIIVRATDDGNINLGESCHVNSVDEKSFSLTSADVRTEKGDIYIRNSLVLDNNKQGLDHKYVDALSLTTGSGKIEYVKGDQGVDKFEIPESCDVKLKTANGRINFNHIKGKNLTIECENGSVSINNLELTGTCKMNCKQGNYKFGNVKGKLDFTTSENTMISPDIDITGTLTGDLILSNSTAGASPNVTINKIVGDINITSNDGGLKIKDSIKGRLTVLGSGSFYVEAGLWNCEGKANVNIQLKDGNVTLNLKDSFNSNEYNNIATEKGSITLNMTSKAKFKAETYSFHGEKKTDRITFSNSFASQDKNVVTVSGGKESDTEGFVKLSTDENIKFNLVANL